MALVDNAWYVNYGDGATTGYYGLTVWAVGTVTAAGAIRRQLAAPAVGSERVFVCVIAGTTHATTEPTWTLTRGAKTTDNTVTWQECTGIAALNGDATNTPSWTITATPPGGVKGTAVTLGQVIKRDSGASYQICTTAGTAGSGAEPAFSNTAGVTTADNTVTWTSLGVVGNFTGWQAPHARLVNAVASTWGQAGNSFYVGDNHAETQASALSINIPGTNASLCFVYCVNRSGSLPPVSADLRTTATITCTSGNFSINLTNGNQAYINGISFVGNSGGFISICQGSTGTWAKFENCNITVTGAQQLFFGTNASVKVELENTAVTFGNTGATITLRAINFLWRNTASAILGATLPTTLFVPSSTDSGSVVLSGVDLSALGTGKTLVSTTTSSLKFSFVDCKLGASVTVASTPANRAGPFVDVISSDSGATNYRAERYWYQGTQTVETTIVRTGGATDGTTPISQKLVTTANSKWVSPFESQPITIWNNSTSAITTLTLYGTTTGGGVPNNDDIWVEVEYLGSGLTPQGSFKTTTKADNLAASVTTNNSSDASTWGGGGAGNGFKIVMPSFTPGMVGPMNITIKAAKASSTYYMDPRPSINGVTVSKSFILSPGVYANELASGGSSIIGE